MKNSNEQKIWDESSEKENFKTWENMAISKRMLILKGLRLQSEYLDAYQLVCFEQLQLVYNKVYTGT